MAKTVMVVDDSASLRAVVRLALEKEHFEVVEAVDGLDALEKLAAQQRVRLIICDVNMPRMDGLTFVKSMKAQAQHRFTPVVMLTTEGHPALIAQGKAAGVKAWMVKPFQPDQLLGVVGTLVGP
ncbi:MAG: response regulator [Myxococcota bacterium]